MVVLLGEVAMILEQGLVALVSSASPHTTATKTGAVPTNVDEAIDLAEKKLLIKVKPWLVASMTLTVVGFAAMVWLVTSSTRR